jgi:predicted nucleotidyltransferase
MDYNKLSKEEKEKLIEKIKEILSNYDISFAIIYGSFARRNYFRDIDIVIKGNIDRYKLEEELEKLGYIFDIKLWDELNLKHKFFAIKYGIYIVFNKEEFIKEKFNTVREYLDFQPFLEKINKYYLEQIK